MEPEEPRDGLSRRNLIRGAGALGAAALLPSQSRAADLPAESLPIESRPIRGRVPAEARPVLQGTCDLTPSQTEGPYYVNTNLMRPDIREGRTSLTAILYYQVVRRDCSPVANALVDVWHADAGGVYSGVAQQGTVGQTFLRGIQTTDANGIVRFVTIYPGYYPGRTTHIHLKVHPASGSTLTTQTYFPDPITDLCYRFIPPYSSRPVRSTRNTNDRIFDARNVKIVLANPDGSPSVLTGHRLVIP